MDITPFAFITMIKKLLNKYAILPIQSKAALWFFVCSVLQRGISIITTPIFTRLLTTGEFGQFNVFISWEGIICAVCILTLPFGVFEQGLIKYYDNKDQFTSSVLGLMTILEIFWLLVYLVFKSLINSILGLSTVQVLLMLSLIWTTSVFNFWAICQRVEYKYKLLVLVTMLVSIAKPIVSIILVLNLQDKVSARIAGLAAVELISYFWMFLYLLKKGHFVIRFSVWKYALAFNIPLIPHYLSQRVLNNADRIMIKSLVGSSEAGIYSLAYSLSMIMTMINTALQSALSPWIYTRIKRKEVNQLQKTVIPTICGVAVLNLFLIVFAPELVALFATKEYYSAIWIIPPVAMSVYFMFVYGFFANVEFYYEQTRQMSMATLAGAILNIILNYCFIQKYGFIAAGYTTLVCYAIYTVCHYMFMRRICVDYLEGTVIYNPKLLIIITLIFMTSGFLLMFLYNYSILRYLLMLVVTILAILFRKTVFKTIKNLARIIR